MSGLRILIEGVGGIGGVVAGELIRAGHDPVLVTGNRDIAAAIAKSGLRVRTPAGSFAVSARAWPTVQDLPRDGRFDVALLLMKAHGVRAAARETLPWLDPQGFLVTCQNGIVEDSVAEDVGTARVVSAIVGWGGTMLAPGVYERTGPGNFLIGELDGSTTPRIRALRELLSPVAPAIISANIYGALWSKLAINCTTTTLGALAGGTLGDHLGSSKIRQVFLRTYGEVIETAEALGIRLETVAVNPRTLYLRRGASLADRLAKDILVRYVGRRYRRLKSSSLQSLERGRPTEVDFLNGYVVARAAQVRVEVPVNERLVAMVKEIEAGTRSIAQENLLTLPL